MIRLQGELGAEIVGVLFSSWNHSWLFISQNSDMLQKGTESGEKKFPVDDDVHILSIFDIFTKLKKYFRISLMKQSTSAKHLANNAGNI